MVDMPCKMRFARLMGALLMAAGLYAYANPARADATPSRLTALDYVEIEQLYAHYAHYLDMGDGKKLAALFTPDGEFVTNKSDFGTIRGQKALAEFTLKVGGSPAPYWRSEHVTTTVMIDPSPAGATGSAYLQNYVYVDAFVKTAKGWRFKTREVHENTPPKP
jgi:hypothetical protein